MNFELTGLCMVAYFAGSIPFGYLVGRLGYGKDIRKIGSGNIGFANVTRTFGWVAGLLTLIGDMGKGLIPVLLARHLYGEGWQALLTGFFAILGAVFSLWLRFRGGKGVGASAGVFAGLAPIPFLFALAGYLIVLSIFGYSSLGSLAGALILPTVLLVQKVANGGVDPYAGTVIVAIAASLLIVWLHRGNIRRIATGTERKLTRSK